MNVQLFNSPAAGAAVRVSSAQSSTRPEPPGSFSFVESCKSWNRGRYTAPFRVLPIVVACALAPIAFWLAIRVPVKPARTMEGGVRRQSTQVPRPRANRVMYSCRSSFIAMPSRAFCTRLWQSFSVGYRYFHRVFADYFPRPWARWTLYGFMIYSYLPSHSDAYAFYLFIIAFRFIWSFSA